MALSDALFKAPQRVAPTQGNPGLASAMAGLTPKDRWDLREAQHRATANLDRAQRAEKTGFTAALGDRRLALLRASQANTQNTAIGRSAAADSGLGWSPAVAGNAVWAAAQAQAAQRNQADNDFVTARNALEQMYQESQLAYESEGARLAREAARLQETAQTIRKWGN